jgi:hypothetical protein
MEAIRLLNLLVRFLLELCLLAAVGYWGFKTHSSWELKILFGIGLPLLIAALWGMFVAPKAAYQLDGVLYLAAEFVLLGSGAVALFASGKPNMAWIYAIMVVANKVLLVVWRQ